MAKTMLLLVCGLVAIWAASLALADNLSIGAATGAWGMTRWLVIALVVAAVFMATAVAACRR